MKCNKCNADIIDSAKFCPECGNKVDGKICCSNCGLELASVAKFCPECGTPVSSVTPTSAPISVPQSLQQEEEDDKRIFVISERTLDEIIGNEHKLLSVNSIVSGNDKIADAFIDEDYFAIVGNGRGKTKVYADFTYRSLRDRTPFNATVEFDVEVKYDLEVDVKDYNFINTDDEDGEDQSSINWDKVGSFAKGAASFIGGFAAGALQGFIDNIDDDDD